MNYWVVRGKPERNNFPAWLEPENVNKWETKSPPKLWRRGDRLFFYKLAPDLCIVGLGVLEKMALDERGYTIFWVRYKTKMFTHPISRDTLLGDSIIRNASFLKFGPAQTVLSLPRVQADYLYRLCARENEAVAEVWPDISI